MVHETLDQHVWGHPTQKDPFPYECAACAGVRYVGSPLSYCRDELNPSANNPAFSRATADSKSWPVQAFKSIHCSIPNAVLPLSIIALSAQLAIKLPTLFSSK